MHGREVAAEAERPALVRGQLERRAADGGELLAQLGARATRGQRLEPLCRDPRVPVDGGGEGDVVPRSRQRPRERQQRAEVPLRGDAAEERAHRAIISHRPRSLSLSFLK